MKLIDKYIFKEFTMPFYYCFSAFLLVFIIGDLFENLDNFILQKVSGFIVLKYYLLFIPTVFVLTTPLALLLSMLYQLGYMSRYNELTALKASGVSFWRIIVPFSLIGAFFSLLLLLVNESIVPWSSRELDGIREEYLYRKDKMESYINSRRNIAYFSNIYNLSFYIDSLSKNEVEGISIREFNKDGSLKSEWYGKKGLWVDSNWWFFDGYIRNSSVYEGADVKMSFFKKQRVPINVSPQDILNSQKDIEVISNHMDVKELYGYIKRNFTARNVPRELLVNLYRKLSIPLTVIIITAFAITFGARISKGGALASVGLSLTFYILYYGVTSFFLAMGKLGRIMPFLAVWTPQIIFGFISVYLLRRN